MFFSKEISHFKLLKKIKGRTVEVRWIQNKEIFLTSSQELIVIFPNCGVDCFEGNFL